MNQDLVIRTAAEEDAAAVATLLGQLGYAAEEEDARARLVCLAAHAPSEAAQDQVYVAALPGKVVGWIQVSTVVSLETGAFAEIRGLVVDDAHRSQGIGQALVGAAEAWALERGFEKIRVRSNVIRERARRFYLRIGYEQTKTQAVFARSLSATGPSAPE